MSDSELADAVGGELSNELAAALSKIAHCVVQLSDEQLWWRPAEGMNSIANLMLHLCGNLRQWVVAGVGGTDDTRQRQQEFDERGPIPQAELMERIAATVSEAMAVLNVTPREEFLRWRNIQGFDVSGLQAAVESVAHFRGHTQEIVHLTRMQLGDAYQYDFVPQTPEQGAQLS